MQFLIIWYKNSHTPAHPPVHDAIAFPPAYSGVMLYRMMLYDWRLADAIFIFNARPIHHDSQKLHRTSRGNLSGHCSIAFSFGTTSRRAFWSISTLLSLWYGHKEDEDVPTVHQRWYLQYRKRSITVTAQCSREPPFEISYALLLIPTQGSLMTIQGAKQTRRMKDLF